jgi:mannosyl-oligosaccharide alpha-1,2-mannosidase
MDLLTIGKYSLKHTIPEVEHLTCFAGAMLGLGAKLLGRDRDMADAQDFTNTCYWLSAATATGIQPDLVEFFNEGEEHLMYENVTLDSDRHHPHGDHLDIDAEDAAGRVVRDMSGNWHWKADGIPVHAEAGGRDDAEPQVYYSRLKGSPPGTRKTSTRYLNRPETIESVYYMYRLTGDPKWQDRGWKMYVSWVTTAAVPGGISSINDVTRDPEHVVYGDNMESFTFAETFK